MLPQRPQWLRLVLAFTHTPPHTMLPAGQQMPSTQSCPPGHALPQVPQLVRSVARSTQPPGQQSGVEVPVHCMSHAPHVAADVGSAQTPPQQSWPASQGSQPPQCVGSSSTHPPAQQN